MRYFRNKLLTLLYFPILIQSRSNDTKNATIITEIESAQSDCASLNLTSDAAEDCPVGWKHFAGKCYEVFDCEIS